MKTQAMCIGQGAPHFYVHQTSLASHLGAAGHVGFTNRLPRPHKTTPSLLKFLIKDADMICLQMPLPKVPMVVALQGLIDIPENNIPELHEMLNANGQYVSLGIIFPMTLLAHDGPPEKVTLRDFQRAKAEGKAVSKPGLMTLHDGRIVEAQWRKGDYQIVGGNPYSADGTKQALQAAHANLCRIADTPPRKPGRKLRDMYTED